MNEYPMTVLGKKLLEQELEHLIKVERENIIQTIAEARALGDLRENADYQTAKERQSHIEGRVLELQGKLGRARVVDPTKMDGDKVMFSATVTIMDCTKEVTYTYQIVGEDEAKVSPHKISYDSPLAKALIGREAGDTAVVKAPKGDIEYEIITVEYK